LHIPDKAMKTLADRFLHIDGPIRTRDECDIFFARVADCCAGEGRRGPVIHLHERADISPEFVSGLIRTVATSGNNGRGITLIAEPERVRRLLYESNIHVLMPVYHNLKEFSKKEEP
jgi:hypothetical protein